MPLNTRLSAPLLPLVLLLLLYVVGRAATLQPPLQQHQQDVGYAFEYGVRDEASGTLYAHTERRHGLVTTGQYTVHLPDGRIQTVKYTADHNGYRATVTYDGVAHHPDRVLGQQSRTVNYPAVLGGQTVPVVGGAISTLNTNKPFDPNFSINTVPLVPSRPSHPSVGNDRTGRNKIPVVPVVPPPPHLHQQSPPQPRPFTVPFQPQPQGNFVVPSPSSFPGRPWHHFTQSPSIHRNTRLPASGNFAHQPNSIVVPNNNIVRVPDLFAGSDSSSNTHNFNDFYNLPSSPVRTRPPRVFPPNTFIPSASEPLIPTQTTDINSQSYNTIPSPQTNVISQPHPTITFSDNDQNNQNDIRNQESLTHLQLPYRTPDVPDSGSSLSQLTPLYEGSAGLGYMNVVTQLNPPHGDSPYANVGNDQIVSSKGREEYPKIGIAGIQDLSQSFGSNFNSHVTVTQLNATSIPGNVQGFNSINQGSYADNKPSVLFTTPSTGRGVSTSSEEAQETTRPTPQPSIVPDYGSVSRLPSPFAPPLRRPNVDSGYANTYYLPIDQSLLPFSRKPFVFDPDASVFHDEPSIIVDFSHRGASHEDDSDTVSLTAPYVVVGGAYSPNPAAKFATKPVHNPNSVANRGIAPPDAADTGNIRLSPGFLPPHLAKLHQEISNSHTRHTSQTPTPVKLKLSSRVNSGHDDGVNRKNLPLRDRPTTFGEGTPNKFSPNSFTKLAKLNVNKKQKRNTEQSSAPALVGSTEKTSIGDSSNDEAPVADDTAAATTTNEEPFLRKIVKRNVSRPNIRNG